MSQRLCGLDKLATKSGYGLLRPFCRPRRSARSRHSTRFRFSAGAACFPGIRHENNIWFRSNSSAHALTTFNWSALQQPQRKMMGGYPERNVNRHPFDCEHAGCKSSGSASPDEGVGQNLQLPTKKFYFTLYFIQCRGTKTDGERHVTAIR
jgi:hypothetical protein